MSIDILHYCSFGVSRSPLAESLWKASGAPTRIVVVLQRCRWFAKETEEKLSYARQTKKEKKKKRQVCFFSKIWEKLNYQIHSDNKIKNYS